MKRSFSITLICLIVGSEIILRFAPCLDPGLFRWFYGNSLSMYMTITNRLSDAADRVSILGLGDSLAMTQFQPELFAQRMHRESDEVFNASYLGMSFPSQEAMVRRIGIARFVRLNTVLYFVNPRRLSSHEDSNTDVLRVGVHDPRGPWGDIRRERSLTPLFDYSRLYGLSRHMLLSALHAKSSERPTWTHIEYLGPNGGVAWPPEPRLTRPPRYPYPRVAHLSDERLEEMRAVLDLLSNSGALILLVPSAMHSSVDPFATRHAAETFRSTLHRLAEETGARYLPDLLDDLQLDADADFSDYGHMNASGGELYTEHLALHLRQPVEEQ